MDQMKIRCIRRFHNKQGFTIIEALIAISIFSIGFMALTTVIWSGSSSTATTARADLAIMAGRDILERLSAMDMGHADLDGGEYEVQKAERMIKVKWKALDFSDPDKDGSMDFKTIVIRAFSRNELRMETYYRHKIN